MECYYMPSLARVLRFASLDHGTCQFVHQNSVHTHALGINDLFKNWLLLVDLLARKHQAAVKIQDALITDENIIRRAESKLPRFD